MKPSTTSARKRSRRSSVTCGMPMRWASARAPVTACGEQQERSPSVAGSDHSSSVTASTSSPASSASCAAAALSTPPLMATSVRRGVRARAARRPPWRRRRGRGAAHLPRGSAAWRLGAIRPPSAFATSSGVSPRAASRKGSPSTSSTTALPAAQRGPAALGVEARLGDAVALHAHGHAHEVAAGRAAGRPGVRPVGAARRVRAAPSGGPRSASRRTLTDRGRGVRGFRKRC